MNRAIFTINGFEMGPYVLLCSPKWDECAILEPLCISLSLQRAKSLPPQCKNCLQCQEYGFLEPLVATGPSPKPSYALQHPKTHQTLQPMQAGVFSARGGVQGLVLKQQHWIGAVMFSFTTTAWKCIGNPRGELNHRSNLL